MEDDKLIKLANKIAFVTTNPGKVASAQRLLAGLEVEIYNHELEEPRTDDIKKIAEYKVRQAYDIVKKPCITLDAGFFIKELNGFPRAFVNFALDTIGIDGILKLMDGVEDRSCAFKECLTYYDGVNVLYFHGTHAGTLTTEKRGQDTGKNWSDLWYVFIPDGYDKTLAQMSDEERNNRKRTPEHNDAMDEIADYHRKTKKLSR